MLDCILEWTNCCTKCVYFDLKCHVLYEGLLSPPSYNVLMTERRRAFGMTQQNHCMFYLGVRGLSENWLWLWEGLAGVVFSIVACFWLKQRWTHFSSAAFWHGVFLTNTFGTVPCLFLKTVFLDRLFRNRQVAVPKNCFCFWLKQRWTPFSSAAFWHGFFLTNTFGTVPCLFLETVFFGQAV